MGIKDDNIKEINKLKVSKKEKTLLRMSVLGVTIVGMSTGNENTIGYMYLTILIAMIFIDVIHKYKFKEEWKMYKFKLTISDWFVTIGDIDWLSIFFSGFMYFIAVQYGIFTIRNGMQGWHDIATLTGFILCAIAGSYTIMSAMFKFNKKKEK